MAEALRKVEVHIDVEADNSALNHVNDAVNAVIREFNNLDTSIRESTSELDGFNDQNLADILAEITQMQREINELGNDITNSSDDVGDLNNQDMADLISEIERIQRELNTLDSDITDSTNGIDDLDSQELNDLLRELERIQREINELDNDISDSSDELDDLNNQDLTELESSFVGVQAAVVATVAAIGGIALAIGAEMMEVEEVFARLQAQTGAQGAELAALEDAARETFNRGYGESLGEVAEALALVKQNMHEIDASDFSNVTAKGMLLADMFDSEISEVTRGTQGLMDAFGITAEKAFDLFTHGGRNGINVSQDMFDQMAEFSPTAKQAGYSVEELFGLMQRGAANGVYDLDRINNSILEFGDLSTDGSEATDEAFGHLSASTHKLWQDMLDGKATSKDLSSTVINELKAMDDQNLANQIGISLWGSLWIDNTKDVMYSMFETTEAMTGFEGATQKAADAVENTFGNRMTSAWRELKDGILEVVNNSTTEGFFDMIATKSEEMVPHLVSAAEGIVDFATKVVESKDAAVEFIDTYLPLIAGLTAGVTAYYVITGAITLYTSIATLATAATFTLGGAIAFLTSPVTIAVAIIAALVAAGVLLYQNWDVVMEKLEVFKDWMSEKFNTIKDNVVGALSPILGVFDNLLSKWNNFKDAVSNFSISGAVGGAVDWIASKVPGLEVGLGRVPYDDMPALLHKDEAVLPKDEANTLRQAGILQGDGTHPSVDLAASQTYNQVSSVTSTASTTSTSVQAPVQIIVQGGATNEETVVNIRDAMENFFADLGMVMPQVREV